ncbi:MAG TPA: patatin-like protein [Gammaproteobacteria bacterium]|nr:patatin-like protein [Gammaproteobacteria bacterium]
MREKELRLALVCFGGVSLAVYMHGISKEILKLVRASRTLHGITDPARRVSARFEDSVPPDDPEYDTESVYFDLLRSIGRHTALRVIVDVIAGASAGGINGVMLARALAHDLPVAHLRDMWLDSGDVAELLAQSRRARTWSKPFMSPFVWALRWTGFSGTIRDPEVRHKLSLFVRSRWFKPPLDGPKMTRLMFDAVDRMGDPVDDARSLLPAGLKLDLFVTLTDFYGYQQLIQIHDPALIREREHRHVLRFSYRRFKSGGMQSDFGRDNAAALAFAARATSSYPGAFPPAQIREIDRVIAERGRDWPRRADFLRDNFRRYRRAGLDPLATSFIDGSVLNNKPFAEALKAIRERPAYRPVDRRLVYIDPDPVQPAPPPSGRAPGFFAALKGALSDLPRNEPIAEELEVVADFNERVRRLRATIDSARPQIARLVTDVAQSSIDGALELGEIRAWREAANERAARDSGFAYQGYVREKLDSVRSFVARVITSICGVRERSPEAQSLQAIIDAWALRRGIVYREDATNPSGNPCVAGTAPPWIEFLHAFDVEFRKRRLNFLIQGQNRLHAALGSEGSGDVGRQIQALKGELYRCLDDLRRYESPEFYSGITCAELQALFGAAPTTGDMQALARYAEDFATTNEAAITRLVERLAAQIDLDATTHDVDALLARMDPNEWHPQARREVLVNYIGFPFWDVLTFSVTSWRDLGEFDEIRVDRISPEDARTLTRGARTFPLSGTAFMHFGAFFSRAFRENDYLLGRLHAIDRLIDIVCDSAGREALAGLDVPALKRRAFEQVLRAEQAHLPNVRSLIDELWAELGEGPGEGRTPSRSDERGELDDR